MNESRPNLKNLGLKTYKELLALPRLSYVSCAWGLSLRQKLEFKDADNKGIKCGLAKDKGYEKKALPDKVTKIDVHVADTSIEQLVFHGKTTLAAGKAASDSEVKIFRVPDGDELLGVVLHFDKTNVTCGVTWLTWTRPTS